MTDPEQASKAGKVGGRARAEKLSPEARKEIASKAARVRWADPTAKLPRVKYSDRPLVIGSTELPCAVLDDGRRVLTQSGVMKALGRSRQAKGREHYDGDVNLPAFLTAKNLKPFLSEGLEVTSSQIEFVAKNGQVAFGYRAEILPDICWVFVNAQLAGKLAHNQEHVAERSKVLLQGFGKVGIIALVDEATGYQADRERDELQRILEQYLVEAMRPWVSKFPVEFFKQVHRLHGWKFSGDTRGPRYVGKLINRYIYDRLPPGVHDEIRARNPAVNGRRKHKHHQFLTDDTGIPHLDKQIQAVTMLMQAADNKAQFEKMLKRVFPTAGDQQELPEAVEEEAVDE